MKRASAPTVAEILAALPSAMWLIDQSHADQRARGFVPVRTNAADLVVAARALVLEALKRAKRGKP